MAKYKYLFSMYANCFYEAAENGKSGKAEFIRTLLKMGLTDNAREIINNMYPKERNKKGGYSIDKIKADELRKYLSGENDITEIAKEILNEYHDEVYINELNDYEEATIIEFANKLKEESDDNEFDLELEFDPSNDDIETISKGLATYHGKILNIAAAKNHGPNKAKDNKHIVLSYTITASEKKALINLCKLIKQTLGKLKHLTKTVVDKQYRFDHLTAIEEPIKTIIKCEIESLKKRFDECYPELEKLCVDIVELLEPKKNIHPSFGSIISFAKDISNDKYKITYPDKFNYMAFSLMISKFDDSCNRLIRDIEKI